MIELAAGDKSYRVRTEPDKIATAIFRAVGAAIPVALPCSNPNRKLLRHSPTPSTGREV